MDSYGKFEKKLLKNCPGGGNFDGKINGPGVSPGGGMVTGQIDTCIKTRRGGFLVYVRRKHDHLRLPETQNLMCKYRFAVCRLISTRVIMTSR